MKLVYAETPATMGQDHSVDDSFLPEGVTHIISEYDPAQPITSEKNQKFVADIKDADIIINSYVDFQEELLDAMDHCKVISFQSTGYNAANLEYAAKKGVAVVSIRDYCTQETAENAIASMMCLQRNTINYNRAIQEDKVWDYSLFPGMKRVEGQTMAIIGFGRIGQHVGRIAGKGLGMKVIAYDPFLPPEIAKEQGVELVDLDTALAEGDVISVHMNLTADNKYFFTKETFASLVDAKFLKNSILEGLVFDQTTSQGFIYAASVCYPQTDLYIPLRITVTPDGKVSMVQEELLEDLYQDEDAQ